MSETFELSEVVEIIEDWWKETKEDMKKELPKLFKPVIKKFEEEIRKSERQKIEKEINNLKKQIEGMISDKLKELMT